MVEGAVVGLVQDLLLGEVHYFGVDVGVHDVGFLGGEVLYLDVVEGDIVTGKQIGRAHV